MTTALAVLASLAVAAAALFVLGVSVAFGSSGFGGPSVDPSREAVAQGLLVAGALAPAAAVLLRGPRLWLVVAAQVALLVAGVRLGP